MIRIDVRNSKGDLLSSIAADAFDPVLCGVDRDRYPMLGHLDPYGDTILNRLQVASLLDEIEELRSNSEIIPPDFREPLVELCRECLSRPHRFLWFLGE